MTSRGNQSISHNGYIYTYYKSTIANDFQTWRCNKSRWSQCKGQAKTTEIDGKHMVKFLYAHNHHPGPFEM